MSVVMITASLKEESVPEVDAAIELLFAAIDREQPAGIRYASTRPPTGVTAVILLQVDDDLGNPLPAIPEFGQFRQDLQDPTRDDLRSGSRGVS